MYTVGKFIYQKIHIKPSTLRKIIHHKLHCVHMCYVCVRAHICVGMHALAHGCMSRLEVSAYFLTLSLLPLGFGDMVFH